jgi:hypothetical protein
MLRTKTRSLSSLLAVTALLIGFVASTHSARSAVRMPGSALANLPLSRSHRPSGTLGESPKPELFVAYWDSDQLANYVRTFSRSGRDIEILFGTFSQEVLVATDRAHDVFLFNTGASTISGYAEGSSTPFETVHVSMPEGVSANDLTLDEQGDFWVAYRCGGSYCATPGNLTEYGPDGEVKQVFSQCLLSYQAIALDRHGNAFAAGATKFDSQTTKSALIEYPYGSTSCLPILRDEKMGAWGGGLQATRDGDLVLDFDAPRSEYLEILGGEKHRHVLGDVPISSGFLTIGWLALAHDGREIWVGTSESETWSADKFSYPAGALIAHAGEFEELYRVYDLAATD